MPIGKPPANGFQKGKSGNPGGRQKKTPEQYQLEEMCRAKTPEALAVILGIMTDGESERNKLSAANIVLERGWGKPVQAITGKDGSPLLEGLTVQFVMAKNDPAPG